MLLLVQTRQSCASGVDRHGDLRQLLIEVGADFVGRLESGFEVVETEASMKHTHARNSLAAFSKASVSQQARPAELGAPLLATIGHH